jgi:LysM repeat protein
VPAAFCPYLGLVDDPVTHFAFPSTAQRCHSARRAVAIDLTKQARDCLTSQHLACSRYRPIAAPATASESASESARASTHEPAEVGDAPRMTPPGDAGAVPRTTQPGQAGVVFRLTRPAEVLAPVDPPAPGKTPPMLARGLRSRRHAVQVLVFVLLLIGVGAVGVTIGVVLAQQLRDGAGSVAASQDVGPAVSLAPPSAVVTSPEPASPVPAASEQPTATPPATPTPSPRATPTPSPVVHVVQRGETLRAISERYGVSQRSIVKANSLANASLIVVGQKLIIPSP